MNGIDDYFKQYFGGQQQGQQQGYGQYPYRERMPKAPKYPYGMGQQSYGYQGFGQKPPQQPMGGQMPRLPGQRLFAETIDSKRQNLMQQYQMQYPKQPTVPSPASQMAKPPAIMHVQEPKKPEQTYGSKFASVFANMVKPAVYGWGGVEKAQAKYKSYEPNFEKIGTFYFKLKDNYGDALSGQSGMSFDKLFSDYLNTVDPNAIPADFVSSFFDWYSKSVFPYQFATDSGNLIQSQIEAIAKKKAEDEAKQREADRLKREEDERKRLEAERIKKEQEAADEAEKYKGTEIPKDIAPYYNEILSLYESGGMKPLKYKRNNDGTFTLAGKYVISRTAFDYLYKIGIV